MEYVGWGVKKELPELGTLLGVVQAFEPGCGRFHIVYEGGESEKLDWSGLSSILVYPGSSAGLPSGSLENNWCCIFFKGENSCNSVGGSDVSSVIVEKTESLRHFDLNLNERLVLNEGCLNGDYTGGIVNAGAVKLMGFDLNKGVSLELDMEGSLTAKKGAIDLNLDANDCIDNFNDDGDTRCFDLNLQLPEDEVRNMDVSGLNAKVCSEGCDGVKISNDDHTEIPMCVDEELKNCVVNEVKIKRGKRKNCGSNAVHENVTPVSVGGMKTRSRSRKFASDGKIELETPELLEGEFESGSTKLEPKSIDETVLKADEFVGFENKNSEPLRQRRGRKRKELLDHGIALAASATGLRRSSRRARMAALSATDHETSELGLVNLCNQASSPAISVISDERVPATVCGVLPLKMDLPPSSLDLDGCLVFDCFYVYSFLRSFSNLLFLSPFELEAFVASVKFNDSTQLFDSIHVSLLRTLRKHLEALSNEGSASASQCLRSLNWDLLDLITWPMFLLQYILLHSTWYTSDCGICQFKIFEKDYYQLPVSAKFEILKNICDDVCDGEAFRSDINRRELEIERLTDLERSTRSESSRKRKATFDIASGSCVTEENLAEAADLNSDECHLCKMDGNLICCDGCPAAFHSRCVGVMSSLLPAGHWYCPECVIEKRKTEWVIEKGKPSMNARNFIRAEVLGRDPYGRLYYASCGYLFVLESLSDDYSCSYQCACRLYNRDDLPKLFEALDSSPFIYDKIKSAICERWSVDYAFGGTTNDVDTASHSVQSSFPRKGLLPDINSMASETVNNDEAFPGKLSDKLVITACSGNAGLVNVENPPAVLDTSLKRSTEVSRVAIKADNFRETRLTCLKMPPEISDRHPLLTISNPHVHGGVNYVNYYEFSRTASLYFGGLTSDKPSDDSPLSAEEIIARQLKVVTNRFSEFSWSSIQLFNSNSGKERCGWCFFCKTPEDGRECLFLMKNNIPAVEKHSTGALGLQTRNSRNRHLIDVICYIICVEDHLHGLLSGPWLNPQYSMIWRQDLLASSGFSSLKDLLLKLESNLHHLALSSEWSKHVDSVATTGSACHFVMSSMRASSRNDISRRRAQSSDVGAGASSNNASGLILFWWRGGRGSRKIFNWKVLPRALVSKAARQGGCKKISGILYPENGDYAKRTKCISWRAAVEASRSVDQLALQVRELDANIKWDEISNNNVLLKKDKSFRKVVIRRKLSEGALSKYLLDFGKRRFVPDVVMRYGSIVEDSKSLKKKYWLEESYVPLHLLKGFEEKRIARKSIKSNHVALSVASRPPRKKGFTYLFSRMEAPHCSACGNRFKSVMVREAVMCEQGKGTFCRRRFRKLSRAVIDECSCAGHKCEGVKVTKKSEFPATEILPKRKMLVFSRKIKKSKNGKQILYSRRAKHPLVVPLRRSARFAERTAKRTPVVAKKRGRKKGKKVISRNGLCKMVSSSCTKKRTPTYSSYWLNGLRLSRRPSDGRAAQLKDGMFLVLSHQAISIIDKPKCSLCGELDYKPTLNYVACTICGVWFHGDAVGLTADKLENVIEFRCYHCLNKASPLCPHLG